MLDALCLLLYPVSAAHTSIFRMDSNSTSYPFLVFLPLSHRRSRRSCPFPPLPVPNFPLTSAPSSRRGGMTDWSRSTTHPTVFPASPSTPPAPATPITSPAAPIAHTSFPNLSHPALLAHPALEESGAYPLDPPRDAPAPEPRAALLRSETAEASRRPMHHAPRLAPSSAAPPHRIPALRCSTNHPPAADRPAVCAVLRRPSRPSDSPFRIAIEKKDFRSALPTPAP